METFKDKQRVLVFRSQSSEEFECSLVRGVILDSFGQHYKGYYRIAQIERLKFLWFGTKKWAQWKTFDKWQGPLKFQPGSGQIGLSVIPTKNIYNEDKLPGLISRFNKYKGKMIKEIFKNPPEAFIAEL